MRMGRQSVEPKQTMYEFSVVGESFWYENYVMVKFRFSERS